MGLALWAWHILAKTLMAGLGVQTLILHAICRRLLISTYFFYCVLVRLGVFYMRSGIFNIRFGMLYIRCLYVLYAFPLSCIPDLGSRILGQDPGPGPGCFPMAGSVRIL